ncbi:MAG: manganese efflux pump MntP family protein [Candidatus Bathyarchaeum tardum]|nr:MAG: manganese efflux pump MntP family protein [Candidatus Bathyarchaeum tardum]
MDTTTLLIATALAMDSFSVAIANGLTTKKFNISKAIKIGTFFGFFQAIMPIIGWHAGAHVLDVISEIDHWVAFALLTIIGSRMIYESTKNESEKIISSLTIKVLLILSIATSIDALAVGLSIYILEISIITLAISTGIITFTLSVFGVYIGGKFGHRLKNKVEPLGGIILIMIGLRILLEHLGII